jgi:hypothetical protein
MAPPSSSTSLFDIPDIFSPRRGRIVSNVECEEQMHNSAGPATATAITTTTTTTSMMMEAPTTGFLTSMPTVYNNESRSNINHITNKAYLPPIDTVQDLTASILERVSHITISADSWTASPAVAEVSFTEDEEKCSDEEPESPPPIVVPCSLIASPLRVKRRLAPPTPLHSTTTPRTCNNTFTMLPLLARATKRRRYNHGPPPLPSSPIVDLSAPIAHGPMLVYSPFSRYDARLDRFASTTITGVTTEFATTTGPRTPSRDRAIANPFLVPTTTTASTWETPTPKARRRRRRLRMKTLPFPFPCLSPMQQQQQQSPTLYCSPITKQQPEFL